MLGGLSACPGGDCSSEHSSDIAACYPLLVEVFEPREGALGEWNSPNPNGYDGPMDMMVRMGWNRRPDKMPGLPT